MGGGHHHGDSQLADIALDGSPSLPDGLVIAHAVEQIHGLVLPLGALSLHANLPLGLLGQQHVHIHAHSQHI
jgi:hypothetical protein